MNGMIGNGGAMDHNIFKIHTKKKKYITVGPSQGGRAAFFKKSTSTKGLHAFSN